MGARERGLLIRVLEHPENLSFPDPAALFDEELIQPPRNLGGDRGALARDDVAVRCEDLRCACAGDPSQRLRTSHGDRDGGGVGCAIGEDRPAQRQDRDGAPEEDAP